MESCIPCRMLHRSSTQPGHPILLVLGKLVIGMTKCEAPESHKANGSPGSLINARWMVLSPRFPTDNA
eukprot:12914684-Prorocentrum_lima.AAC.1